MDNTRGGADHLEVVHMIGYESIQATHILGYFCQNMTSTSRDFSAILWLSKKESPSQKVNFCLNDEKTVYSG